MQLAVAPTADPVLGGGHTQRQSLSDVVELLGSSHFCPTAAHTLALPGFSTAHVGHFTAHSFSSHVVRPPCFGFGWLGGGHLHTHVPFFDLSVSSHSWSPHVTACVLHSSSSHVVGFCGPSGPVSGSTHSHTQSPSLVMSGSMHFCPASVHTLFCPAGTPGSGARSFLPPSCGFRPAAVQKPYLSFMHAGLSWLYFSFLST